MKPVKSSAATEKKIIFAKIFESFMTLPLIVNVGDCLTNGVSILALANEVAVAVSFVDFEAVADSKRDFVSVRIPLLNLFNELICRLPRAIAWCDYDVHSCCISHNQSSPSISAGYKVVTVQLLPNESRRLELSTAIFLPLGSRGTVEPCVSYQSRFATSPKLAELFLLRFQSWAASQDNGRVKFIPFA